MEFYWELIYWVDNPRETSRLEIPPSGVQVIQRRMDNGQPIHTARSGTIPANKISGFRPTDRQYNPQPLLEAAAHAFNEPVFNGETIVSRWVKKPVPQDKWNRYYAAQPSYRNVGDMGGMTMMAFKQPVHQIDLTVVQYCTEEEIKKIEN